jgi:hypothetical protein
MSTAPCRFLPACALALALAWQAPAAVPVQTVIYSTGDAVPGAGDPTTGVPASATFTSFSGYLEDGAGHSTFLGRWTSPTTRGAAIFHNGAPIAVTGGAAPTGADDGAKFAAFGQPLLSSAGVAFPATLTGSRVNQRLLNSIWSNTRGSLHSYLSRTDAPPDAPDGLIEKVLSFSLRGDELLALVQYKVGRGGVTNADRTALIVASPTRYATLLRTGRSITLPTGAPGVTKTTAFNPAPLSPGHDRSHAAGIAAVQISLNDGTTTCALVTGPDQVRLIGSVLGGVTAAAYGFPDAASTRVVAVKVTRPHSSSITSTNDEALLDGDPDLGLNPVLTEGDNLTTALKLGSFDDPIINDSAAYAFIARLTGVNMTPLNNRAVVFGGQSAAAILARLGDLVPDRDGETRFEVRYKTFLAVALPDGPAAEPIWLARLSGPNVAAANNLALFARDDTARARRLLRTGETLQVGSESKTIATFTALAGGPFPIGGRRAYGDAGTIAALVNFVGDGQALVRITY